MKKHQTVKFVAVLFFIAAVVLLLLGLAQAIALSSGGLGAGWGAGWHGWVLLPTLIASACAAIPLFIAGALLYFLAQIEQNLSVARTQPRRTAGRVEVIEVPAAGVAAAGVAADAQAEEQTPAEEVKVETPEVAAPAAGVATSAAGVAVGAVAVGVAAAALGKEEAPAEAEGEAAVAPEAVAPEGPGVEAGAPAVEVAAPAAGAALPAIGAVAAAGVAAVALGKEEPPAEAEATAAQIETAGVAAATLGAEKAPDEAQVVTAETGSEDDMLALQAQLATLQTRISDLEETDVVPETGAAASDLLRISGISEEYRGLLEASGVDTVPALAGQDAAKLYERVMAANLEKHLVPRPPTLTQVADWIEQAKQLPTTPI